MKQYLHPDIEKLIVVGDIHGNFKEFFYKIRLNAKQEHPSIPREKLLDDASMSKIEPFLDRDVPSHIQAKFIDYGYGYKRYGKESINDCIIVVAGDCGFGFNKLGYYHQIFNKYISLLEQNNIYVYFVRGNHDDPSYFNNEIINYSHIKTIPDYSIIQLQNKNVLCVGGAISIDRIWRKQEEERINKYKTHKKKLYWIDEAIKYNQEQLDDIINNGITINGIISHSAPHFAFPDTKEGIKGWVRLDKKLNSDIKKERNTLTKIYEYLRDKEQPISFWCYGHFHMRRSENHLNIDFFALSEMEFIDVELENTSQKYNAIDDIIFNWEISPVVEIQPYEEQRNE